MIAILRNLAADIAMSSFETVDISKHQSAKAKRLYQLNTLKFPGWFRKAVG